jgi:hypothetical protein
MLSTACGRLLNFNIKVKLNRSHSHYVPRDRDPDVPLENFPTSPPRPNERIMPDGTVVAK